MHTQVQLLTNPPCKVTDAISWFRSWGDRLHTSSFFGWTRGILSYTIFRLGRFWLTNPLHSKAFAGKTNHAPWLRSRLLCEGELRRGCGSGLFLLDTQSFHLPELPKQVKIVLLKQKFIPLPTRLRRTPSVKRTTINHSLGVPCLGLTLSPDSPHARPPIHIHTPVHAWKPSLWVGGDFSSSF